MKYKDLREMDIKDWDGQPFYAIVEDDPEEELWGVDDERLKGEIECFKISGYCRGRWIDASGVSWSHAYPIEWNQEPKKPVTNTDLLEDC